MEKILIVDDSAVQAAQLKSILEDEYDVSIAQTAEDGLRRVNSENVSLVLLDVVMPGMDGFDLCRKIRDKVDCPILFVTAKTEENALMEGLGMGGDDYICKPFGIGELRARVAAHLRREQREKRHRISLGEAEFSLQERRLYFRDQEITLTKSEYAICEYLALNRGQVFSKERILEHVFGFDGESNESAITEHVKNIRAKFQKFGINPIETVWGIGYRWK